MLWVFLIKDRNMSIRSARGYIRIFIFSILGSILLGISMVEIDFLNNFLGINKVPIKDLFWLILLRILIIIIMESYKKIKYHKSVSSWYN